MLSFSDPRREVLPCDLELEPVLPSPSRCRPSRCEALENIPVNRSRIEWLGWLLELLDEAVRSVDEEGPGGSPPGWGTSACLQPTGMR